MLLISYVISYHISQYDIVIRCLSQTSACVKRRKEGRKKGNVLFNDILNIFY